MRSRSSLAAIAAPRSSRDVSPFGVNLKIFDAALVSEVAGADKEGQTDARGRSPLLLADTPPKVDRQLCRIVRSASQGNVSDHHAVSSRSWMRGRRPRTGVARVTGSLKRRGPALPGLRSGATRIKVEHSANRLDLGPMRVAGNDDVNAARGRVQPQLLNIVQYVDGESTQSDHLGLSTSFGPLTGVGVPSVAVTGAIRRSPAITSGLPISPPWMICATPVSRFSACGRRPP